MLKKLPISLTIVFTALGILLSTQFQSQKIVMKTLSEQTPENLAIMIKNLTDKKFDLVGERMDLNGQLKIFENDTAEEDELAATMQKEVDKLKLINGESEAIGPGISITIYKPSGTISLNFEELVAIINDLWHLKAEAIAVNGHRITGFTRINENPNDNFAITIDGKSIQYPIVIEAIGDSNRLRTDINIGGGNLFQLQTSPWNFKVDITEQEELQLPRNNEINFKYAKQTDKK